MKTGNVIRAKKPKTITKKNVYENNKLNMKFNKKFIFISVERDNTWAEVMYNTTYL